MAQEHIARWYHLILYPDWLRRVLQRPDKVLADLVTKGMKVADIGCGLGLYTVEMAKLVGEAGKVYAVDMQAEMLRFTKRKAKRTRVGERIELVQCTESNLSLLGPLDFVLTMYVAHEVKDRDRFFRQIHEAMAAGGRYLLAEPRFHVGRELFERICAECGEAGFVKERELSVAHSLTAIFAKKPHG